MIDVSVNSRVLVVFTEPVAPPTVTTATVQLLRGSAPVPGTVHLVDGTLLEAEFVPDQNLESGVTYRLVVTRGVLDDDGDALETEVTADFTTATSVTPVSNQLLSFSTIGSAPNHSCGIEAQTGLAYCWGDTHAGALGIGDRINDGSSFDFPTLVNGGAQRFSSLSVSSYNTCGIERSTGFAYCWGYNNNGQLGDGTMEIGWVPKLVVGNIRFSSISAGVDVTCGVQTGTSLGYCWGKGGLIGDGTLSQRSTPTLVAGGHIRFTSVSASESHVCGIEADSGFAYCWGSNSALGDGTTTDRLLPTLASGGRRFSSIDAEYRLTCGIETESGLAYCWGKNTFGQVGDGTTTDRLVPTLVNSGSLRFSSVNAGGEIACAIATQNSGGYCWGRNHRGQLGDGTTTERHLPTLVGGGTPRFSSISANSWYQCGVEAETGFGYCWGGGQACPEEGCEVFPNPIPGLLPAPRSVAGIRP
jgi:alpha-tubulin suppressor-like RCC1 family protein